MTAQSCSITPVKPAKLSKRLKGGINNVTADCNCSDNESNPITDVGWFFPNGSEVGPITITKPNTPYFTNDSFALARLIIPVFTDAYKGNYTCKLRGDDSTVSNLQLLIGKKL